jgi:undecaprenyl diphosphate synthase
MRRRNPKADPPAILPDVPPERIPRHVAVIMDGNGRWAEARGFVRMVGHRNGARAVRALIENALKLGVEVLTLYSFSMENWKRPADEVQALMALYLEYLRGELDHMARENIRFVQIGRDDGLPPEVVAMRDEAVRATANNRAMTLCLAVNYGSRGEIADAVRSIAAKVAKGELAPGDVDEALVSAHLSTASLPDPDLLIRTAGEMRVSNFLLWQISYAELHVTPTLWPDFEAQHLHQAVRDFASRCRRFGGLVNPRPTP